MAITITSRLIMDAALQRGWIVEIIDENKALYSLELPNGSKYYVRNITSYKTGKVNGIIADNKEVFAAIARSLNIGMPEEQIFTNSDAAEAFLQKYKKIVVKPTNQAHGTGITVNITTPEQLHFAIEHAQKFSETLLLQQHVDGDDYRVLMIDHQLAAAAIRKPAYVIGDGVHTARELIELENARPEREVSYMTKLVTINIEDAERYLSEKMEIIPPAHEEFRVMGMANIGKGGVSIDITDTLDSAILKTAKQITEHLRMGLCGVDFIVGPDGKTYLIEINLGPSLGLHEYPWHGKGRGTPDKFLDWLVV